MILVIDNYDSFVYNLARYFERTGEICSVIRNDAITIEKIRTLNPKAIVISPGPCSPKEAGICVEMIKELGPAIPIFGVCLGHQCIGEAYGNVTVRGKNPVHGKSSVISHNGEGIFAGLPRTLTVGRYHSLVSKAADSPLRVTALGPDDEIMAMQHETFPVYGVQFHPESVLTEYGLEMVQNFLNIAAAWRSTGKIAA